MNFIQKICVLSCMLAFGAASLNAVPTAHAVPALDTQAQKASLAPETYFGVPAVPHKVVINRQNTRAFAQSTLKIVEAFGAKVVVLPLPKQASNVQLSLPQGDGTIVAWQTEKAMPYKPHGFLEKQRITYESMANSLGGALTALQGQYEATVKSIENLPPKEAAEALKKALPTLALIGTRMHSTQRDLDVANARVALFKDDIPLSQQLVITVDTKLDLGKTLQVAYSYTLDGSFWRPSYVFDASTTNDTINFKLMAHIQQNSDLDWDKTEVQLSTAQGNEPSLPPVRPWVVRKSGDVQARAYNMPMQSKMLTANADTERASMGTFDGESTLAVWNLKKNIAIPEGQTTLILQEQNINAPLERIARPSSYGGGKVWLSASPAMTLDFLPEGTAQFLLDGITVGQDSFAVKKEKMPLFFGIDPLVTVEIKKDIRKSDEDGLLHKEQVWTWGWTYTVHNKRHQAVKVRIEEPQTQLEDAAMSVTYADKPKASKGEDNTFVWQVDVPAQGKNAISREITVKAPKGMKVNLDR